VTATFPVGNTPSRLVLDGNRGLWIGLDGDGSVRRFNLDTLTPTSVINLIPAGSAPILDMAPSPTDTDTIAVSAGRTYLVRDGILQPDSVASIGKIVMVGNYVFGNNRARLTPSGLTVDGVGVGVGTSELQFLSGLIYRIGSAVDPLIPLQPVVRYSFPLSPTDPFFPSSDNLAFALNTEDNSYLMLNYYPQQNQALFHLTRYARSSGALTGYARFAAVPGNWSVQVTAAGTNRAAVSLYNKLFLLDLNTVFVPGDLQVSAVATPNPALFAQLVTETITLSNRGPGFVVLPSVTNRVSGSARFTKVPSGLPYTNPWNASEFHWDFQILAPGESTSVQATVVAADYRSFTNTILAGAQLDSNPQNNSVELPVTVINSVPDPIARIGIAGSASTRLGYDGVTDQLFIGDTNGNVFSIRLNDATLGTPPFNFQNPIRHVSVSEQTRKAWIHVAGYPSFYSIPLDGGNPSQEYRILANPQVVVRDFKASPVATQLVAYSDSYAIRLFGNFDTFGNPDRSVAGAGAIQFSPDGSKLYESRDFDCSLRLLNVTNTIFTVAGTYQNIACYDFTASSNLLYFNNGLVFDPATGTSVTNLNLTYPSWMLLDPAGPLNVLTRSQSGWEVRRLHRDTLATISIAELGPSYTPTDSIQAGTNRIAFRNASGEAILVRLDSSALNRDLTAVRTTGGLLLRFTTISGALYRVEQSPDIVNQQWTAVGSDIIGTGLLTEVTVSAGGAQRFFRIARLP
jgi:hypothetical protein